MRRKSYNRTSLKQQMTSHIVQNEHTLVRVAWSLLVQLFLLYLVALLWLSKKFLHFCIVGIPKLVKDGSIWWQDRQFQKKYGHVHHYGSYPPPRPKP